MSEQGMIDANSPFYVADWRVDPASCRISRGLDEHRDEQKIEPKAMTVLVCLAQQQGQVVSREELEEKAWQGMVVGYDSLASAIIKLRKAFGDSSKNPEIIETVPKKGYRLISPVRLEPPVDTAQAEEVGTPASVPAQTGQQPVSTPVTPPLNQTEEQPDQKSKRKGNFAFNFMLAVMVMVLAGLFTLFFTAPPAEHGAKNNRHVIAVLPFKNLSDDPQQDYFSDGITVDLITDLSKIEGLSVIARNSVFVYKNSPADIKTVREELGVDYVVEGSVRKRGNQIRIAAQLIDATSSINVWAERFDGELNNIFAFQDAVTSKIISALSINLTEQDRTRLADKYSDNIEAYDEFLRGWQSFWLSSREGILEARGHFRKAIELDNNFARAYANLALTYLYDHLHGWSKDDENALKMTNYYADKAIEINPNLPNVYWVKGFADIFNRDYQQSLLYAQKAIDLSPNFADGYGLLATTLNYAGKPEEAEKFMLKAMELNPKHPAIYNVIYGEILFNKGDYRGAIRELSGALESNPENEESRIWLAAAYGHTGDIEDASWQLEQLRFNGREVSLERLQSVIPFKDPKQRQAFIDGLSRAVQKPETDNDTSTDSE